MPAGAHPRGTRALLGRRDQSGPDLVGCSRSRRCCSPRSRSCSRSPSAMRMATVVILGLCLRRARVGRPVPRPDPLAVPGPLPRPGLRRVGTGFPAGRRRSTWWFQSFNRYLGVAVWRAPGLRVQRASGRSSPASRSSIRGGHRRLARCDRLSVLGPLFLLCSLEFVGRRRGRRVEAGRDADADHLRPHASARLARGSASSSLAVTRAPTAASQAAIGSARRAEACCGSRRTRAARSADSGRTPSAGSGRWPSRAAPPPAGAAAPGGSGAEPAAASRSSIVPGREGGIARSAVVARASRRRRRPAAPARRRSRSRRRCGSPRRSAAGSALRSRRRRRPGPRSLCAACGGSSCPGSGRRRGPGRAPAGRSSP